MGVYATLVYSLAINDGGGIKPLIVCNDFAATSFTGK